MYISYILYRTSDCFYYAKTKVKSQISPVIVQPSLRTVLGSYKTDYLSIE